MKLKKTQMEGSERSKVETQTQHKREGDEIKKEFEGSCSQGEKIT
jgi:hypothetical protein